MRSARSPILGNPDRLQDYPTRAGKKNPEPARPPTTRRGTTWRKGVIIVTMRTLQQPIKLLIFLPQIIENHPSEGWDEMGVGWCSFSKYLPLLVSNYIKNWQKSIIIITYHVTNCNLP